jgi:hypothetical protein
MPHPATANLLAAALDAHRRGDLDRCIPLLRQIVQLDPDDPAAAVMLGSLLRSRRLLDESETVLRACIARHPSVAEAHANLGVTLGDQGRNDQAIAYAREAVRLRPDQPLMHSNGSITFGCLNNFIKVNPPLIRLWATVLQRVENSTMVLHCKPGRHWRATLDLFAAAGVDPGRVQYVGYLPAESYFAQYHNLDIALDTTPYAGGTTTCDALFMGVPVVTIRGGTAVGRMGVSILGQIGHDQWVAENGAEYVEIAVSLAADPMALNEIRQALRRRVIESPLMDATGFTAGFEAGLREAWRTVRDAEQL